MSNEKEYTKEELIETLEKDSELTAKEYKAERKLASATAKENVIDTNEVKTERVSEATKHRRIQSNFYGTAVKFFIAYNDRLYNIEKTNAEILKLLKKE